MIKKSYKLVLSFICIIVFYISIGFFVIQPIGALPEGITIMYFRFGLNTSFITSPDGILIENDQGVSLFGRMAVMAKFSEVIVERRIVNLPYSSTMYQISTGGKEFEN
jgi:hypothetical protein